MSFSFGRLAGVLLHTHRGECLLLLEHCNVPSAPALTIQLLSNLLFCDVKPSQGVHHRRSISGEESRTGSCQCGGRSL